MQYPITLMLLLLGSSNLYAQATMNPDAHKSYVRSSNGNPVLSSNGQCVRTGTYATQNKLSCFVQATSVTETKATAAIALMTQAKTQPQMITYSYVTELIDSHVYFDFDKHNLSIAEQEKLELAIQQANLAHKLFKVSVAGHTDSRGTEAYNYNLAQRRINSVVNYLNLRGIATNSTMVWGESQRIFNANGSENYEHSRRAEVLFKIQRKIEN